ncbi:MAG TPA: SMP-30/gluconolactonase/LRE family protein [Opitutus sp.]|nr:SMP-30/gluconolactonase/LRE family protein [Opitutus sp.]
MNAAVEVVFAMPSELGEGPFWHADRLHWVDIEAGALHRLDIASGAHERWTLGEQLGAAAPHARGGFVVALASRIGWFDPARDRLETIAVPDPGLGPRRFNDGKCDPRGRFVVGTLDLQSRPGVGALYRVDPDGHWEKLLPSVGLSNGLAWSADGGTFYFIDTAQRTLTAYDYDLERGRVALPRVIWTAPADEGGPDGMTIDATGRLWIGLWGGKSVVCVEPASGRIVERLEVPADLATACAFGGADGDELFVTSARVGYTSEKLREQPLAGAVFRLRPGVSGPAAFCFGA